MTEITDIKESVQEMAEMWAKVFPSVQKTMTKLIEAMKEIMRAIAEAFKLLFDDFVIWYDSVFILPCEYCGTGYHIGLLSVCPGCGARHGPLTCLYCGSGRAFHPCLGCGAV